MNACKHLERASISPAIREMQVEVARRSHYTPTRVTKIKNTDDIIKMIQSNSVLLLLFMGLKLFQN